MQLSTLPIGNAFQYYSEDGKMITTAIRCKGIEFTHVIPCIHISHYFLLPSNTIINTICELSEYDTGLGTKPSTKISPNTITGELGNMDPGMIANIASHRGYDIGVR
jgi:hypothetical protein